MSSVLVVAWLSVGAPGLSSSREGICARCGSTGQISTQASVSKTFTAYDTWAAPGRVGTCAPCTWAYTTPALRSAPHAIALHRACDQLTRTQAYQLLRFGALPLERAITLPLHPGRKHLLPLAQWGHVTIDDACLPWGATEAARLEATAQLRAMGFTAAALTAPAPPFQDLRRHNSNRWHLILQMWQLLDPWRHSARIYLDAACALTNPPAAAAA